MLNIRFNSDHTGAALSAWLRAVIAQHAERFDLDIAISGESFLTEPGPLVDTLRRAIVDATGVEPKLDTGGGTSDARFIARYCPVAEFGLVGATMHQADERVPVAELRDLARIYRGILAAFLRMSGRARGQRPGLAASWWASCVWRADVRTACSISAPRARRFSSASRRWSRFPLVGGALMLLGGGGLDALSDLLATLCALLAPPVLSFEVARLWGREAAWLRFATAFNWCQWVPVFASLLLLVCLAMLAASMCRFVLVWLWPVAALVRGAPWPWAVGPARCGDGAWGQLRHGGSGAGAARAGARPRRRGLGAK